MRRATSMAFPWSCHRRPFGPKPDPLYQPDIVTLLERVSRIRTQYVWRVYLSASKRKGKCQHEEPDKLALFHRTSKNYKMSWHWFRRTKSDQKENSDVTGGAYPLWLYNVNPFTHWILSSQQTSSLEVRTHRVMLIPFMIRLARDNDYDAIEHQWGPASTWGNDLPYNDRDHILLSLSLHARTGWFYGECGENGQSSYGLWLVPIQSPFENWYLLLNGLLLFHSPSMGPNISMNGDLHKVAVRRSI